VGLSNQAPVPQKASGLSYQQTSKATFDTDPAQPPVRRVTLFEIPANPAAFIAAI